MKTVVIVMVVLFLVAPWATGAQGPDEIQKLIANIELGLLLPKIQTAAEELREAFRGSLNLNKQINILPDTHDQLCHAVGQLRHRVILENLRDRSAEFLRLGKIVASLVEQGATPPGNLEFLLSTVTEELKELKSNTEKMQKELQKLQQDCSREG